MTKCHPPRANTHLRWRPMSHRSYLICSVPRSGSGLPFRWLGRWNGSRLGDSKLKRRERSLALPPVRHSNDLVGPWRDVGKRKCHPIGAGTPDIHLAEVEHRCSLVHGRCSAAEVEALPGVRWQVEPESDMSGWFGVPVGL